MLSVEQARAWYPNADPVHGFDHVLRVYKTARKIAQTEGGDFEILSAAALLHDVDGSATEGGDEGRADHHQASAALAGKILRENSWPEDRIAQVQHCIRAHRFRNQSEPPGTIEAKILFDADKLDVLGAIGIVRTIAYDVVNGQPVFEQPSKRFMETGQKEPGEGHSSYHEYLFKLSKIKDMLYTPSGRALAEERHRYLADFFERLALELRGEK
jgi:uncharacterized protein